MRSEWVSDESWEHILAALMPANRLAIRVSLTTGLRIDDVLSLKSETVRRTNRPYVVDSKTGKRHRIYLPVELWKQLNQQSGVYWVFEGRLDPHKHRTRQAVWKDVGRAAAVFRRSGIVNAHVSPHSARKAAAVRAYKKGGLTAAQKVLNHGDDPALTLLYALADVPGANVHRGRARRSRPTTGRRHTRG